MGTSCVPSFANLFLDQFETKALNNSYKPSHYSIYRWYMVCLDTQRNKTSRIHRLYEWFS